MKYVHVCSHEIGPVVSRYVFVDVCSRESHFLAEGHASLVCNMKSQMEPGDEAWRSRHEFCFLLRQA